MVYKYSIIPYNKLNTIDFSKVINTSIETVRNNDANNNPPTLSIIQWDGSKTCPATVVNANRLVIEGKTDFTKNEIINIISSDLNWTGTNNLIWAH